MDRRQFEPARSSGQRVDIVTTPRATKLAYPRSTSDPNRHEVYRNDGFRSVISEQLIRCLTNASRCLCVESLSKRLFRPGVSGRCLFWPHSLRPDKESVNGIPLPSDVCSVAKESSFSELSSTAFRAELVKREASETTTLTVSESLGATVAFGLNVCRNAFAPLLINSFPVSSTKSCVAAV